MGLNAHRVFAHLLKDTLHVHKTIPTAVDWLKSGRSLRQEREEGRTNSFLTYAPANVARYQENVLAEIAFLIRHDMTITHFSAIAMLCPPKPNKIFANQIHGGFMLLEQNIQKNNRANNPKTYHQSHMDSYKQYPKTPFFRMDPLLYHKFESMVIFRPGNLHSPCSPRNQDYQRVIPLVSWATQ